MALGDLTQYVRELGKRVESKSVADAAAEAMEESITSAARKAMGGNLTLSGLRAGPSVIKADSSSGRAEVTLQNTTLADKGRRRASPARARGRALATPFGPRMSVKGSTTRGKEFIEHGSDDAFDAGIDAAMSVIGRGFG